MRLALDANYCAERQLRLPLERAMIGHARQGPLTHDFRTSLAKSNALADAPWWMEIYRQAFPTLISAVSVRDDGWAQRGGIDRVITLSCGRTYTVDEKVRDHEWPDVWLERWSDEARRSPGWIQKPMATDFIAYAFLPSGRCFLLPVAPLQRAWRLFGRAWIQQYGQRRALNRGYVSSGVPVPVEVLMSAMIEAMTMLPCASRRGWPAL